VITISLSRRQFLETVIKTAIFASLPSGLLIRNQESTGILSPYIEAAKLTAPVKKTLLKPLKKVISFYNNHTGEFLKNCQFWADNKFCPQALAAINRLCRDHRTGSVKAIDPQLFVFLHQILEKVETLKAEWHTSTVVSPPVNLVELNPSRLRPRKSGVLIRHIKGVSDKVAAECLGVDVKQIRVWLESGALVGYRPTGGNWKIPRAEISAFAKRSNK